RLRDALPLGIHVPRPTGIAGRPRHARLVGERARAAAGGRRGVPPSVPVGGDARAGGDRGGAGPGLAARVNSLGAAWRSTPPAAPRRCLSGPPRGAPRTPSAPRGSRLRPPSGHA